MLKEINNKTLKAGDLVLLFLVNIHENENSLSKNMFFRRQQREKEFGEKIVFFNHETGSIS